MDTAEIDEIVHAFLISQICIYGEVSIKNSLNRFFKNNVHCYELLSPYSMWEMKEKVM